MATNSLVSHFRKHRETNMCPPDKLHLILNKVFPKKASTRHSSGMKLGHSDVLGFHNLDKHIASILDSSEATRSELTFSQGTESKAGSSSGSSTKARNYLKGIFSGSDKKAEAKASAKKKKIEFEIERKDGRLGPKVVTLQQHPLDATSADPFVIVGSLNFYSIKADCCVFKGKWMYEVMLGSSGLMQIGWCTATCRFTREEGVGDTAGSYAFDGYRETKWNNRGSAKYGEQWNAYDVVTCLLDLDDRTVSFCLNGENLGVAFRDIPTGPGVAYFPAFSVAVKQVLQVNFGAHVMDHPVPGYLPLQSSPLSLANSETLVRSLHSLVNCKAEKMPSPCILDSVTECFIASHIFARLSTALHDSYVVESSFTPLLYELSSTPPLLLKVLDGVWNLLEESAAEKCISHVLSSVVRRYKIAPIRPDFFHQKKLLTLLLGMAGHQGTKAYLLEHAFSEMKDDFPHMFNIKQPSPTSDVMDGLSAGALRERITAVEDIQRDILKVFLDTEGKENFDSCQTFSRKFRKMAQDYVSASQEHLALCPPLVMYAFVQRLIDVIRQQWNNSTVSRANYVPAKGESQPDTSLASPAQKRHCPGGDRSRNRGEGFLPPELFYSGMLQYADNKRVGGSMSHLLQEHRELLEKEGMTVTLEGRSRQDSDSDTWREDRRTFLRLISSDPSSSLSSFVSPDEDSDISTISPVMRFARVLLQQSSKLCASGFSPTVSRKRGSGDEDTWLPTRMHLLELTDSCLMIYTQTAHQQMDKIDAVRTKNVNFAKKLKETEAKLSLCSNSQLEGIKECLEDSKKLLQKQAKKLQRNMNWVKASTYAPESQHNLWWLLQICLKTVENMSAKGTLFTFLPEFYITGTARTFKCLREYFHPTQPIHLLPDHKQVLIQFARFLSHHHCDTRIINTDVKTMLANALASFVTHPLQLKAIESMSSDERRVLLRSLLIAYDVDKPWVSMGHRILASMWRGMGFALRYDHPPYMAKIRKLFNRDTDPYASEPLLNQLRDVMIEDKKLSSDFVHSIVNHLNWCFSEFIDQIREVHTERTKPSRSSGGMLSTLDARSLRQVRIVDMLFEISVSLLRVLELTVTLTPETYLHWELWDKAEVLVNSLVRVVNQILTRVVTKQNVFSNVVSTKHPGLRNVVHYPLLVAVTGILASLLKERENPEWTRRAVTVLLKDPGFSKESFHVLLEDDPFYRSVQPRASDRPSTSTTPPTRPSTTEGYSLKHREEVSSKEYEDIVRMVERIDKAIGEEEREDPMDEDSLCTICYANEITVSFNPCGHTSCKSCISHQLMNTKECFFCKVEVQGFDQIVEKSN